MELFGEYKFFRQLGGVGHFAHVKVRITPADARDEVTTELESSKDYYPPENFWIPAAHCGCLEVLHIIRALQNDTIPLRYSVKILLIGGTTVDTLSNDVRVAAALAVYRAFFPDQNDFEIVGYTDAAVKFPQRWRL